MPLPPTKVEYDIWEASLAGDVYTINGEPNGLVNDITIHCEDKPNTFWKSVNAREGWGIELYKDESGHYQERHVEGIFRLEYKPSRRDKNAAKRLAVADWKTHKRRGNVEFLSGYPTPSKYAFEWWEERYLPIVLTTRDRNGRPYAS